MKKPPVFITARVPLIRIRAISITYKQIFGYAIPTPVGRKNKQRYECAKFIPDNFFRVEADYA